MIRNYFLLFFRNLKRQKLFSVINLLGLTVSIVSTLLIYLYVRQEFSFDRFHKDAENIYRVNQTFIWGENTDNQFASTGPGVAYALQNELPEVKLITSLHTPGNSIISYTRPSKEVITFEENKVLAADSNFFKVFNFPMVAGNMESALTHAQTMVMSESTARKYFGTDNPIGKLVMLGSLGAGAEQRTFEVTGVVKDVPDNSYINFDILLSMNSFPVVKRLYWSWIWTQLETYVVFAPGTDIANTRTKLATIPKKYAEETLQRTMNTSYDEYIKSGKKWELFLQPITKIHLPDTVVLNRISDSGNSKIVYSMIGAAIFIMLLSCINFMNLSTAQFTRRIKEASIRKILGLGRKELSIGYFVEALTFCALALLVAMAVAQMLLPAFNYVTGKHLHINLLSDPTLLISLVILIVFMAVVSSSYPALFLSGFQPVEAMKGKLRAGREGKNFRNGLVVFQFGVSIVLMVCTVVVFQQLNFVSKQNLGFNKDNLVVIKHVEGIRNGTSFTDALQNIPGVVQASQCTSVPPGIYGGDKFSAEGLDDKTFPLNFTNADERFIPTMGIKLKYGKNFSIDTPGDETRVILNEAAIKKIGWPLDESVIGRKIETPGGDVQFEIAGIVSDFNYWPLATPIEPMGIFHLKNKTVSGGNKQFEVIRLQSHDKAGWENALAEINKVWKIHAGDAPFQYEFVDMAFAEAFKTQEQFGKVLTVLAGLAILIACLGLLGMIIYSLEHRAKEIGIRKVSGASVMNILTLISKGYTRLIIIAFILAAPLAWYIMNEWLKDFAYRVTPSPMIFVAVGLGILVLAGLITSYHSVKAALMNPVDVLRDE